MSKKSLYFWGVVLLQVIVLAIIIIRYTSILLFGQSVLVQALPVDPRDVLRGDFVILSYPINQYSGSLSQDLQLHDRVFVTPIFGTGNKVQGISNIQKSQPSGELFFRAEVSNIQTEVTYKITLSGTGGTKEYVMQNYSSNLRDIFSTGSKVVVNLDSSGEIAYIQREDPRFMEEIDLMKDPNLQLGTILSITAQGHIIELDYGADRFFVKEGAGRSIERAIGEEQVFAHWKVSGAGKVVVENILINDIEIR